MEERVEKEARRMRRERLTVARMIGIYCRGHHGGRELCGDCAALLEYANRRLDACRYQPEKPACSKCPTHCYGKSMRERIREVMRFAGPRMLLYHPILGILHMLDGRRAAVVKNRRENRDA